MTSKFASNASKARSASGCVQGCSSSVQAVKNLVKSRARGLSGTMCLASHYCIPRYLLSCTAHEDKFSKSRFNEREAYTTSLVATIQKRSSLKSQIWQDHLLKYKGIVFCSLGEFPYLSGTTVMVWP